MDLLTVRFIMKLWKDSQYHSSIFFIALWMNDVFDGETDVYMGRASTAVEAARDGCLYFSLGVEFGVINWCSLI